MACYPLKTSTVTGMVCTGRQRRAKCSTPACGGLVVALCDYPVTRKGQPTTCSAKVCDGCRVRKSDELDRCPPHARLEAAAAPIVARGDVRVHLEAALRLWVRGTIDEGQGSRVVIFSRHPPDRHGNHHDDQRLQKVPLEKWLEKTRPAGDPGRCRGCDALIEWFRSADWKAVPLDPVPHPDGNIVLDQQGIALYAARLSFPQMYLSHFATCPRAGDFRRRKK